MTGVERVRIDTERNFLDVLDKVHQLTTEAVDPTHVFTLSQVYEGLLLKMGEKGNDGGQFFTPRQVIKAHGAGHRPASRTRRSMIPAAARADSSRRASST